MPYQNAALTYYLYIRTQLWRNAPLLERTSSVMALYQSAALTQNREASDNQNGPLAQWVYIGMHL
jgi:hypothetical protein